MPRWWSGSLLFLGLILFACNSPDGKRAKKDRTPVDEIHEVNEIFESPEVYSPRKLDSLQIEEFLSTYDRSAEAEEIRRFYARRDHQYAWFLKDSLSESANSFLALINSGDTLHKAVGDLREGIGELIHHKDDERDIAELELALTAKFFHFASKKYGGLVGIDLNELDWYIPRRKKNYDALIDSLAAGKMDLTAVEPVHPQYTLLKDQLKLYHALLGEPWDTLAFNAKMKKLEPGKKADIVPALRQRLQLLGDLALSEDSLAEHDGFDSVLVEGVRSFQKRHGLLQDGIVGPNVLAALNTAPKDRLMTLLVNMERMRWLPERTPPDVLLVNIPEFKLHVYEDDRPVMEMEIVVGKAANRTVIFSDTITYLVFSPTWTIPKSITRNEILPALQKDPHYLKKKNMERIGGTDEEPIIRQRPGAGNALGRVKFMFPNSYSIYLHDTPAKSLFARDQRAFSHGCIRVSKPTELAEYLLRNDTAWTPEKIEAAMLSGKEMEVGLKEPRPVMISYFTAWADVDGTLNFREDIYGHDARLARELFSTRDPLPFQRQIALEHEDATEEARN